VVLNKYVHTLQMHSFQFCRASGCAFSCIKTVLSFKRMKWSMNNSTVPEYVCHTSHQHRQLLS